MDGSKYRENFYEVRHATYERLWVQYREQMIRDIAEQVFMTCVASAISSNVMVTTLNLGMLVAHALYLVSNSIMSKFFMDLKAHEARAKERVSTYYLEGPTNSKPNSLSERATTDRIWGDSMIAALCGHPVAYYTTGLVEKLTINIPARSSCHLPMPPA